MSRRWSFTYRTLANQCHNCKFNTPATEWHKYAVAKCFHKFSNPCNVWLRLYKSVLNDTDKMQLMQRYIMLVILLFSVFLTYIDTVIRKNISCINFHFMCWGRMTHICVNKLNIFGSDNGLSPGRRQAIKWTNAGILLTRTLGTKFSDILNAIHAFLIKNAFQNVAWKMASICLGLNVSIIAWLWARYSINILYSSYYYGKHKDNQSASKTLDLPRRRTQAMTVYTCIKLSNYFFLFVSAQGFLLQSLPVATHLIMAL